jgi:hypothetical protein
MAVSEAEPCRNATLVELLVLKASLAPLYSIYICYIDKHADPNYRTVLC